jgi:Flp pilus assembly protein TadG
VKARAILRRLWRDERGIEALEFIIGSSLFFALCFGILEGGMVMWTGNAMKSAATEAARCAAIGSSLCPDVKSYAVSQVQSWVVPDTFASTDVTVTAGTTCNAAPGTAVIVSISHKLWANFVMPPPFSTPTLRVSSCFPSAA